MRREEKRETQRKTEGSTLELSQTLVTRAYAAGFPEGAAWITNMGNETDIDRIESEAPQPSSPSPSQPSWRVCGCCVGSLILPWCGQKEIQPLKPSWGRSARGGASGWWRANWGP